MRTLLVVALMALVTGCAAPREALCRFEDEANLALPRDAFPDEVRGALTAEGWAVAEDAEGRLVATKALPEDVTGRVVAWPTTFSSGENATDATSVQLTVEATGPPSREPVDVEASVGSTLARLRALGEAPVPPVPPTRDGSPTCTHGD